MIGEQILKFRSEKGWSQVALAEEIGVSKNTLFLWEQGSRVPPIKYLRPLATALECSIDDLFG